MRFWINGNEANIQNRVGVNQYAANVLAYLEKQPQSQKHEFVILLQSEPLNHLPEEREGWKYQVLPGRGLWILSALTPHLVLSHSKPDVLFTPSHYAPPVLTVPSVISIMDLGYLKSREQFNARDFYQLKYWTALSIRQAKKIIAISESTKEEIVKNYPKAKGKIEVTLLGYDKTKFGKLDSKSKIDKIKRKYGINSDYLLYLGTLKPNKNIEGIVRAFVELQSLPLTLVIAGKKGWLYEKIFKLVSENNLEDRVIFTDFVPEEEKAPLIAGASVFVSPSFWEGFGIHVLEAMAVGTPVVCSGVGSLPEVGGEAVVYVDPQNPSSISEGIREAVKNQDVLRKRGFEQAKKFSWEKTAVKTLQILESVGM